jgi:hypothetical protein
MKNPIIPALTALCLISNLLASQVITNDLSISINYAYEANGSQKGRIYTTPAPITKTFLTSDLISQLRKSYPNIITKGAKLQVLLDTNNNITTQVKNTNSLVVNVSEVIYLNPATNSIDSGSLNTFSGASTNKSLSTIEMIYDDTSKNQSNGISFSFQALNSSSTVLNPTKTNGIFSVKTTFSIYGGIGDGFVLSTNNTNQFIIKSATINATGNGFINFNN